MTSAPVESVALQPPTPASPKHFGAAHDPGTGGAAGGAGAGAGAVPGSGEGACDGVLGEGVVAGVAAPLLAGPRAGRLVGAFVCERGSAPSSALPEQPPRLAATSVPSAATVVKDASLVNKTLMYHS